MSAQETIELGTTVERTAPPAVVLQRFVGRSLPSKKYGAWIVAEVRGNIEGRSRLVTGNLKGEQWVWTRQLVAMLDELDSPNSV